MKIRHFGSGLFACAAIIGLSSFANMAEATVTIERDSYGVPKITADTDKEMWFAFGFAQARDRLIQLEIMRQEAYGKLPVVGSATDNATNRQTRNWRRLHLFPNVKETLQGELDELAKSNEGMKTRSALFCFTAGIQNFKNFVLPHQASIVEAATKAEAEDKKRAKKRCSLNVEQRYSLIANQTKDLTKEERTFILNIFHKQKLPMPGTDGANWEAVDSLALFHLRVMHEFSLRNTEMKNLKLLNDLVQTPIETIIGPIRAGIKKTISKQDSAGIKKAIPKQEKDKTESKRLSEKKSNMILESNLKPHRIEAFNTTYKDAGRMFNSIKWALHPNAKTTIPVPDPDPDTKNLREAAKDKALDYHKKLVDTGIIFHEENSLTLNGCKIYNPGNFKGIVNQAGTLTAHNTSSPFPLNASNWWVISQPQPEQQQGGTPSRPNSLLYNGPQISAIDPSLTYQVSLQSPSFQFAGNAYIGSTNFWQGHNGTMAFGLTAGNIDVSDVFCVEAKKVGDYWGYGNGDGRREFLPILDREAKATFKKEAGKSKGFFKAELDNIYTVTNTGWPVLAIDKAADGVNGTAYILRYNWQGLTASTLHHWLQATQAENIKDWNTSLDHVAGNFNLSAAHTDGEIAYRLTGALPVKKGMKVEGKEATDWTYYPDYDPRLPAPMSPEEGWPEGPVVQNYHKLQITSENLPRNSEGVASIANWNQKPFINMPDGDLDYDAYTPYDRVFLIERMLKNHIDIWSHRDILEMNGRLQRMDVNYIIFLPFLKELDKSGILNDPGQRAPLKLMLSWDGKRGDYRKGDARGLHKGHVLFYYWLESLNDLFKFQISRGNPDLIEALGKGQMKLKQPKLSWQYEENVRVKLSTETSHNTHLGSRIMLQALHAAFKGKFSKNNGFQDYDYDDYQHNFFGNAQRAKETMKEALKISLPAAKKNGWDITLQENEDPYFPAGSATFSGLSKTLGLNDTQVGFRPGDPLEVQHFRNRGALNIAAALWPGVIHGANISSPGIREYRGAPPAVTEEERARDWSVNQLYMFRDNEYRPMHSFTPLAGIQDDSEMATGGNVSRTPSNTSQESRKERYPDTYEDDHKDSDNSENEDEAQ